MLDIAQSPAVSTTGFATSSHNKSGVHSSSEPPPPQEPQSSSPYHSPGPPEPVLQTEPAVPPPSQVPQSSSIEHSPGLPNPESEESEPPASVYAKAAVTHSSTGFVTPCDSPQSSSSKIAETGSSLPNDTSATVTHDEDMETTIDEFMPNAPDDLNSQVHLNSNALTTQ